MHSEVRLWPQLQNTRPWRTRDALYRYRDTGDPAQLGQLIPAEPDRERASMNVGQQRVLIAILLHVPAENLRTSARA